MLAFVTLALSSFLAAADLERICPPGCLVTPEAGLACDGREGSDEEDWPTVDLTPLAHNPFVLAIALGRVRVDHPEILGTLPALVELDLFELGDQRLDLAPVADRGVLGSASLARPNVKDLSVLARARRLTTLRLEAIGDADVSFIADLAHLDTLVIDGFRAARWGDRPWPSSLGELVIKSGLRNGDARYAAPLSRLPTPCRLRRLDLYGVHLADPDALARCAALEQLEAVLTDLADLAPVARMKRLARLDVAHSKVADLRPLAGLRALQELRVDRTAVADLAPIAGLDGLTSLDAAATKVTDLNPLAGLKALADLRLERAPVRDLGPLAGLPALSMLSLRDTRASNLQPLLSCPKLSFVDLRGTPAVQSDDLGDFKRARPTIELVVADDEVPDDP